MQRLLDLSIAYLQDLNLQNYITAPEGDLGIYVVALMDKLGFFSFVFPFILIFSVVFLLLEFSSLLKTKDDDDVGRRLHIIFSLSFAMLAIAHQELIVWLSRFIPGVALFLLAIILLIMALSIYIKGDGIPRWARGLFGLFALVVILVLSVHSLTPFDLPAMDITTLFLMIFNSFLLWLLIPIGLLLLAVAWVTGRSRQGRQVP